MDTYGLIGKPLSHSFSARYFNHKFEQEGVKAVYINLELDSVEELLPTIEGLPHLKGLNVTIPYKRDVIPLLDELSPEAARIGAVNVININRRTDNTFTLSGFNSDYIGFAESLRPLVANRQHFKALVLGTGGASLAVKAVLDDFDIPYLSVSRTSVHNASHIITYADLTPDIINAHNLVINTTPVGMSPNIDAHLPLPWSGFSSNHIAYDLIYNPEQTSFMQHAQQFGAITKNGLDMLHRQAEAAWKIWNSTQNPQPISPK